jgi:hypothetical protein
VASWWDILFKPFGAGQPDWVGDKGAVNDLTDSLSVTKVIWASLSDYRMWRSLGWIVLGILLMIIGFLVWNRSAVEAAAKLAAL